MSHKEVFKKTGPLLLSIGLASVAFGFLSATLPIKARLEGFSDAIIGFFGAFFYVGFILGCVVCPAIIRRVQHARAYAIFLALCVAAPLLFFMVVNPYAWLFFRFLTGFCLAGARNILESWLNSLSTMQSRKITITTYAMIVCTMETIGQNILGSEVLGNGFWIAAICFSFSIIPIVGSTIPIPEESVKQSLRATWIFQTAPLPALTCLCVGLINGPCMAYTSLFLFDKGFDGSASILFMSCMIFGGALAQIPSAILARMIGYQNAILLLSFIGFSLAITITAAPIPYGQILLSGFIFGATLWPVYSLSVAHANDSIEKSEMVHMASVLLILYAIGSVAGSFAMSWIASQWGIENLFIYYAVVHVFVLLIFLLKRAEKKQRADQIMGYSFANPRLPEFSVIY